MPGCRPPKTLKTTSSVITVTPATMPPSSQSRRGAGSGRFDWPPWTTPLCRWPAGVGVGGCSAPLAMGTAGYLRTSNLTPDPIG